MMLFRSCSPENGIQQGEPQKAQQTQANNRAVCLVLDDHTDNPVFSVDLFSWLGPWEIQEILSHVLPSYPI